MAPRVRMVFPLPKGSRVALPTRLILLGLLLVGGLGASPAAAAIDTVYVYSFDFSVNPQGGPVVDAVITVGDSIRWVRQEGNHTTTSVAGSSESWNAPLNNNDLTFTRAFSVTGTFFYYCQPHGFDNGDGTAGGMSGTITVLPAGTGACCLTTGDCVETTAASCFQQGGTFQGSGTDCVSNPCPNASITVALTAIADNTLYEDPAGTTSNGTGQYLYSGVQSAGLKRRGVVRFDVSSIPSAALIQEANLQLYCNQAAGAAVNVIVHRGAATWGEGTTQGTGNESSGGAATVNSATWLHRFYNATFWATPGGDFAPSASATLSSPATSGFSQTWTGPALTADVQGWVDGTVANAGWILRGDEAIGTNTQRFATRETATAANRPALVVKYLPSAPTGACCFDDGTCDTLSATACAVAGGIYQGDNTACVPNLCPLVLTPYVDPLPLPAVAAPTSGTSGGAASYALSVTEFNQQLHRDLPPTRVWGYGGTFPGPTIEATVGNPVAVTWINDLRDSTSALRTSHFLPVDPCMHGPDMEGASARLVTHLHGGHVGPESDGYPEQTILPGERQTFHYPNNQLPATLWYHDHALGITRLNVMMGLAGFYLIRDAAEAALNLPSGEHEIPLAIQDRTFGSDGRLRYPDTWTEHFFGDKAVVNGKVWPYLNVKQGKYRFRMLNGSNSRVYTLKLSNGAAMVQIGSDGGLLTAPVARDSVTLAPGERADLVIDFALFSAGTEILLKNSAPAPFPIGDPMHPALEDIMKFIVQAAPGHTAGLPGSLRPVTRILESESVQSRDFELARTASPGPCGGQNWTINGMHWDDVTEFPVLGTTEIWRFINHSESVHPMHLHLVEFQILDRQPFVMQGDSILLVGSPSPPTPPEAGWKDTAPVNPNEVLRVIARFEDFAGRYAYHCHILEHEDHEMMRQFQVVHAPVTGADPAPRYRLALRPARPNPFNPRTRLEFELPRAAAARLDVFDVSGRLIATLLNGPSRAGPGWVEWDGKDDRGSRVGSGIYLYRLSVDGSPRLSRKMALLK